MTTKEAQIALANLKRYISGGGAVDRATNEAIDMAIKALEKPEPHWIPCSERPPKGMDFVLLTVRRMNKSYNQRPFISVGYVDMNQISWWCAHDGDCKSANVEVIAWMPLPEPYKEVAE